MRIKTAGLPLLLLLVGGLLRAGENPKNPPRSEPRSRVFTLTMTYPFSNIPKSLRTMEFWFPIPPADGTQKIFSRLTYAPYPAEFTVDENTGNHFMHFRAGPRGGVPMRVKISLDFQRLEDRRGETTASSPSIPAKRIKAVKKKWLVSDGAIPIERPLKTLASTIVRGKKSQIERARAIYDHVTDKIKLIRSARELPGAGFGNVSFTLQKMQGTSADLASVFVGLCRAASIPARTVTGMLVPVGTRTGTLSEHHSWAEFFVDDRGWLPADPAEGQRRPVQHDYYFGSLDENRITLSRGRGIKLIPRQAAEPLNFFDRAYWEGDHKAMPAPLSTIQFTELDKIPITPQLPLQQTQPAKPESG